MTMIKKKVVLLSGVALVSLGMTACQNKEQASSGVQSTQSSKSSSQNVLPMIKKSNQSSINENSESQDSEFSNEEWMLMGYLFYKDKDVNNLDETIQSISNDFDNGELTARQNSANSYTLSNKYGSVDIEVKEDEITVTNDGITRSSKGELVKLFSGKEKDIKKMTKYIK